MSAVETESAAFAAAANSFAPIHTDPAEDWTSVTIENFGYGNDTTDPERSLIQQSSTGIITGSIDEGHRPTGPS